jgi:hypothetical protein
MNLRQVWTEVCLLIGGIFLAFILLRREPQAKPDNTQVGKPATQTKAYSSNEEIFAAHSCAGYASGASVGQDGSRDTTAKAAAVDSTNNLCHHDIGRIGRFVSVANPGAPDEELLKRDRLAHELVATPSFTTATSKVSQGTAATSWPARICSRAGSPSITTMI